MIKSLNPALQPQEAPVAQRPITVTGYDFTLNYQRSSITAPKIRNFDLSQSAGGTLTIGGTTNQNGKIQVYNPSSNQLAEIDNQGIQLFGTASLQLYDTGLGSTLAGIGPQNGTAFIDAMGYPLTLKAGTINLSGVVNLAGALSNTTLTNPTLGTPAITGGTMNNATLGTPRITGGTMSNAVVGTSFISGGTYNNPTLAGTILVPTNNSTAALGSNQVAVQVLSGSAILVINVGGTNFYFQSAGTF